MSSLLLIKQEEVSYQNIIQLMKYVLKSMIDCDEFTYIIREEDQVNMYQTLTDSYQLLSIDVSS